jgi:hypothetical protein
VARAHQAELDDSVDDVNQLDVSPIRLQRGTDEFDRFFHSSANLVQP